jgi:hypothetical protein
MVRTPNPQDYDALVYTLLHEAMDRLIELAAVVTSHSDILDEEVEQGSAEHLLRAQMGIENGEEEIDLTQKLIHTTSNILIQRRARDVIIEDGLDRALGSPTVASERHPELDTNG